MKINKKNIAHWPWWKFAGKMIREKEKGDFSFLTPSRLDDEWMFLGGSSYNFNDKNFFEWLDPETGKIMPCFDEVSE